MVVFAGVGCKSSAPAPKGHDHSGHSGHSDHAAHRAQAPAAAEAPSEPTGPRLETDSFVLEVAPAQSGFNVGKAGAVAIALESKGEWHVNQEYPIRVDLTAAPGVGLKDSTLEKGDAKEFTESNAQFLASLEPAEAGEHDVRCDVSFALCTDENCVLEKRSVAMQVKVQ